jgi:hypothetical protein
MKPLKRGFICSDPLILAAGVDPRSGVLVTSYANIVESVQGPRMALIIDPGDGVYPESFRLQTAP